MISDHWNTTEVYNDLVRDSLRPLLPVILTLTWAWSCYVLLFDIAQAGLGFLAFGVLLAGTLLCFRLQQHHLRLAVLAYLAALMVTVTLVASATRTGGLLYFYLPVVLIAAMLGPVRLIWPLVIIASVLIGTLGRAFGSDLIDLVRPILVTWIATLVVWLVVQRQQTALDWAMQMFILAQKNATAAREHRAELQRVLRTLDIAYTRLQRANQALIFAQEAADHAYRFKSEFVANVSHELRTPLNLILGFSEMMTLAPESYGGVPLPRAYRGDMMAVYRSARHLLELINDVLDLSQIEAGKMRLATTHTNLNQLVEEAAAMVHGLAEAQGLDLQLDLVEPPLWLALDQTRIRQVLLNLLTNALRYTERGFVRVKVCVEGEVAHVTVQDSGRGIDPANVERAFQTFTRLDEQVLREGSGLGLAVSKKFVELHGGRIWIESQLHQGTQLHFTLPLADQDAARAGPLVRSAVLRTKQTRPVVLVLHNDVRVLPTLRRYVADCAFTVAAKLEQAIEIMQTELPAVILLDEGEMALYTMLLQRLPAVAQAPVIVCPLPSLHQLGALLGVTDYLPKPVNRQDLANALLRLPARPTKVLVIDDDPHIVRLLARMLRAIDSNLQVLEAFDGATGLAVAQAEQPHALFLDLVMPEMNGYRFLQALRTDATLAEMAVFVVSVRSVEEEMQSFSGEVRLWRTAGLTLTELLHLLSAVLPVFTEPATASPTSAAARLKAAIA